MSVLSAAYKAQLAGLLAAEKDLSALKAALKELGADAALMGASMLPPPAGTAADIASLAVSLGRGDWGGELWDVVGLIPIVGDGAKVVGKGAKVANRMKDLEKAIAKAEKVIAKKQNDLARLCKNSRVGKDKTTRAARHSSCVDCSAGSGKSGRMGRGNPEKTPTYKGKLRGSEVELPGIKTIQIKYKKRSPEKTAALRRSFNSKERKEFLERLANDPKYVEKLKRAGLTDADISRIANGKTPPGWQVHHKLPLDDGGNNNFDNLILIKNEPSHKVITNTQKELTVGLKPGETKTLDFPIPEGIIYPPKLGLVKFTN